MTPNAPPTRLRGSTYARSHYISADEDASETDAGDAEDSPTHQVELIDLDGDETPEHIDLTGEEFGSGYTSEALQADLTHHVAVNSARTPLGATIQPGVCIECTHEGKEAFLRIVQITQHNGATYLHGNLLQRASLVDKKYPKDGTPWALHSLLPWLENDLYAILRVSDAAATSISEALVTKCISDVGVVRKVIFTNQDHKVLKGHTIGELYKGKMETRELGTLFCRGKYIEEMNTAKKRIESIQIRRLDQAECDPEHAVSAERLFDAYRPTLTPAKTGSSKQNDSAKGDISTKRNTPGHAQDNPRQTDSPKRKREVIEVSSDDDDHTFDAFKRGYSGPNARRAFGKKRAFRRSTETVEMEDSDRVTEVLTYKVTERLTRTKRKGKNDSCKTLKLNFPGAAILKMDVSAFAKNDTSKETGRDYVDVIHISFPCQGHSSANTGVNEDLDAVRISTAYGTLDDIIRKCKPRCLTLEQVPGILWKKDGQHFRAQVRSLTAAGYDLRWKVINVAQYGNSQARKRVIVIAACPGHILPPFPVPTHGPGLQPFVTVADILAKVPKLPPNDPMSYATPRDPRKYHPWNPNIPLRCCITGGGGDNWHPSGTRKFSYQEKSQLQGFPATHKYFASSKKSLGKQIGNAVPPVFAKALFEAIVPCLEDMDEKMSKWKEAIEEKNALAARKPIVLD